MYVCVFFFFNDTATTEIYTLSLHDALPICPRFFKCQSLFAAAPSLFKMPISRCGSAPLFILSISCAAAPSLFKISISRCGSALAF